MFPRPRPKAAHRLWSQKQTMGIVLLGVTCLLGTSVVADNNRQLSQDYATCLEKANGVTFSMMDCIAMESSRQDTQLNENYKKLTSKISPERRRSLLDAQRAWITFRDANCKFYGDPEGGTSARLSAKAVPDHMEAYPA